MLYTFAVERWSGKDEIVEIGSLYGKSTVCLAMGARDNPEKIKTGKVHAFDKWVSDDENAYMLKSMSNGKGSFRHIFDENTADFKEWIVPHQGDAMQSQWDKPIGILFLDCSVSGQFHEAMFRTFYPHLDTGSILIHQDFFLYRSFYLPAMMLELNDYFQIMGNADTSMCYQMTRPIPESRFDRSGVPDDETIVKATEELIPVFGGLEKVGGGILGTMLVYFYRIRGNEEKKVEWAEKIVEAQGIKPGFKKTATSINLANALCA